MYFQFTQKKWWWSVTFREKLRLTIYDEDKRDIRRQG